MRTVLKITQIVVAISTTIAIGAGLVWPGMMVVFVVPVLLVYVVWTIRAAWDHRLSILLSLMGTTLVAVFIGGLGLATMLWTFGSRHTTPTDAPIPLVNSTGEIVLVEPTAERLTQVAQAQMQVDQRARIEGVVLSVIGLGAWFVIGMYSVERKWALGRTNPD